MINVCSKPYCVLVIIWLGVQAVLNGQQEMVLELSSFPVFAGAYAESTKSVAVQTSDRMRREVRVDMQSRGSPGYQTDITVRGGIFEGTGMMIGGLALFDPQTGHYFSEIPLHPAFFSGARLLTGSNNSINGFNSTAGSVDWQWAPIEATGSIQAIVGTDNRYGGHIVSGGGNEHLKWQVGLTGDRSDGSVPDADFELFRVSGRLEISLDSGTLQLFGGHVDKFYGWPGMYTGFSTLSETEDYSVDLLGWQWESHGRWLTERRQSHRIGGYWRQLRDDYEFNRYQPNTFFEHKTEVWSLQGDGRIDLEELWLDYRWLVLRDRILRSTSLTQGAFSRRDYAKAAIELRRSWAQAVGEVQLYGGLGLDTSSEDETIGTPNAGLAWTGDLDEGTWKLYAEYSRTSQVPGYTVLNSPASGLFGGNPSLGRERADTVEMGLMMDRNGWTIQVVAFERQDADLVDWVYDASSPSARQASPVDMLVQGIEGWLRWKFEATNLELGYAFIDKDPDYLGTAGDASFYALNYARHRLLASIEQELSEHLNIRLDAEYREHPENALRSHDTTAFYLNLHLGLKDFPGPAWNCYLDLQNLTEEDFEPLPGTPGRGREVSASFSYSW